MRFPPDYPEIIQAAFGSVARQTFAGQALQGMLAALERWPTVPEVERMAELSVVAADALIAELAKERAA